MELKIVGTIEKLMPISKGVSSTGREWVKQDIVMSMANGQFVKHFTAAVMGQERIDNFKLRVGDNIVAYLDIDAKEYNGRWYNDIRAWRVQRGVVPAPGAAAPVAPAGVPAPTAPVAAPAPAAPAAAAPAAAPAPADNGDLPF